MTPAAELLRLLIAELELLRQPIDFVELEGRGVISQAGAWYRVRNLYDLPEHAAHKIREIARDGMGTVVKFAAVPSSRLLKRPLSL